MAQIPVVTNYSWVSMAAQWGTVDISGGQADIYYPGGYWADGDSKVGIGFDVLSGDLGPAQSHGPQTPWSKSCAAQAAGSFLVHGSIDALGAIPVVGEATAAAQFGLGLASTAYGVTDTSVNGSVATGLGTTGIVLGIAGKSAAIAAVKGTAELIPVLGQAVAIGSVIWDGASALTDYIECSKGHS